MELLHANPSNSNFITNTSFVLRVLSASVGAPVAVCNLFGGFPSSLFSLFFGDFAAFRQSINCGFIQINIETLPGIQDLVWDFI